EGQPHPEDGAAGQELSGAEGTGAASHAASGASITSRGPPPRTREARRPVSWRPPRPGGGRGPGAHSRRSLEALTRGAHSRRSLERRRGLLGPVGPQGAHRLPDHVRGEAAPEEEAAHLTPELGVVRRADARRLLRAGG